LNKNKKNRELEKELETTLNFSRRTIISTTKPVPHVLLFHIEKKRWRLDLNLLLRNNHN
jgi:hypothetical protein